jgi:acyl-coenzyme A thioesterase PaaI-like protein
MLDKTLSLQDQFAPNLICFGCGPANPKGLQIKSFVDDDRVVAEFQPKEWHQAFEGMLNGGITGALLDCHMNWTAAWHLMQNSDAGKPPCSVTSEFSVKFKAPTPIDSPVKLVARVVESAERWARTEAELIAEGEVTAIGSGVFVAVKEGHPAWHRW